MSSPRSVSFNIGEIENDQFYSNLREAAGYALDFMKSKYNKNSITPGESLLEFFNYENNDNTHLTSLFSLAILMTHNTKDNLDNIDISENNSESSYQKLITYIIQMYENKLI